MIEARGLAKRFGPRLALAGVDLDAEPGDVLGLIGPNGAGKTTTIKILATLVQPDAGSARVAGIDAVQDADTLRARIGYMPERFGLYDELTCEQYLDFFARVHGYAGRARRAQVAGVLELTDLTAKREDPCEGLSKGVRQRLFLAKTLLHDPPGALARRARLRPRPPGSDRPAHATHRAPRPRQDGADLVTHSERAGSNL
ncbi:ABC transporter ATP-binding protein [Planctomycetota bacterium]|nr:ABC transporter ATP-binding protein [Planctomycetota bacterium]